MYQRMGGARNLKLEREVGTTGEDEGKGQGTGNNNFCLCGPNVDLCSVVVCINRPVERVG